MVDRPSAGLLRELAEIESGVAEMVPATIAVAGGEIAIEPARIVVSLPVASVRFELTPSAPGVAQLSRTQVRIERRLRPDADVPALHVSLRTRGGRLQLVAPVEADADEMLGELPALDADGARVAFADARRLLVAARRLGTDLAQVNESAHATHTRAPAEPDTPSMARRARLVGRVLMRLLRSAWLPMLAALVCGGAFWLMITHSSEIHRFVRSAPPPPPPPPATTETTPPSPMRVQVGGEGFVVASVVSGNTWVLVTRMRDETFRMYRFNTATGLPRGSADIVYPNAEVAATARGLNAFRTQAVSGDWLFANIGGEAFRISLGTGVAAPLRDAVVTPRLVELLAEDDRRQLQLRRGRDGELFAALSYVVAADGAWRLGADGVHAEPVAWDTYLEQLGTRVRCGTGGEAGLLPDGRWFGVVKDGGERRLWMEATPPEAERDRFVDVVGAPPLEVDRDALEAGALLDVTSSLDVTNGRVFRRCDDDSLVAIAQSTGWRVPVSHTVSGSGVLSLVGTDRSVRWSQSLPGPAATAVSIAEDGALLVAAPTRADAYVFEISALDPISAETRW